MPWYVPNVPESIKKRAGIYLLHRYFGQFFEEKLSLDQLSVDLYHGTGTVKNVSLDVQALNELGRKQNWPVEFVDGYLEELFVSVPWASLLKDSSYIEVKGLKLTIQPKQRIECATSLFESMWSSMTSSIQLAQECMKQEATNSANITQPFEGIERFAQAIDSILSRVKVKFLGTIIQLEHVPKHSNTGVGIVINITSMEYLDEAGDDPPTGESTDDQEQNKAYVTSSFTIKKFYLEGVTFSTIEFPSEARTFSRFGMNQSQTSQEKDDSLVGIFENCSLQTNELGDEDEPRTLTHEEVLHETSFKSEDGHYIILFGRLLGRQEIRLRLKHSEDVSGPKVTIDVNLGSFTVFLSPRQALVLLELANGFMSPEVEDASKLTKQKYNEKPMTTLDYQRIEQELQQQLHPLSTFQSPGLQGTHGWSTAALEESDSDENFLPMTNATSGIMYDSAASGVSCSMESSINSSMVSSASEQTTRTRRRISNMDSDPTAEISHFQIKLASVAIVLLHEDILTLSVDNDQTLITASVIQMQTIAERFFNNLGLFAVGGYGNRDFENAKLAFEKACKLNHLRLIAAPIQIEGDETTTSTAFSVSGKLTAAKLELLECLTHDTQNTMDYVQLLHFSDTSSSLNGGSAVPKPNLKLTFKYIEKSLIAGVTKRFTVPKTEITITLDKCTLEADITIMDRISALFNSPPVCVINNTGHSNVWGQSRTVVTAPQSESKFDIKILSPSLAIRLRFPIPDFRPPHDMQRNPWWKRNIRPDYLIIQLTDLSATSSITTNQICQKYILQCRTADISYVESENSNPLPIAKAEADEKYANSLQNGFNCLRLVLLVYPKLKPEIELEQGVDPEIDLMSQSMYGALGSHCKKQCGPFSAKRVIHESDTPHSKPQQEDAELIIPGDKKEMNDFIEVTTKSAKIQLELSLPIVSMQLISKHIYELIYNRINNDLLLWEPSAPKLKAPVFDNFSYTGLGNFGNSDTQEMFAMCRSGIQYESESDSDDDTDPAAASVFYSVCESRMKRSQKQPSPPEPCGQSYLTLDMHISRGLICLHTPVRDVATNVIPEQHGEFFLNVENANVFSVTGYRGNDDLGYVCVQVQDAQMYHCDMKSSPSQSPPLKEVGIALGSYLHPTIYKSEPGMLGNSTNRGGNREMLAIAVRIQANHETHHVKTVRVAIGINKATLRHRMCQEPNSWITQMIDFFNVIDYPIPGYHAKDILTELHLHLWDCSIDYRPLNLPLRSIVTMGNFSMSSHLSAQANTSTLRFIAEDCAFFLSEKVSLKVDLKKNYVNVIEIGLFELSLRTNDKKSGINPHIDLRASNNVVHIRTCADSGRALMQLLSYIANDGDLTTNDVSTTSSSNYSSPHHQVEQELINVEPQEISNLSKSQHQHVNELLGEAMKESITVGEEAIEFRNSGAKLFFFPDESHPLPAKIKPLPQVTRELGDVTYRSNKSSDTDDDFCFVGDEAGLGILSKNGLPEIRWLTDDPLRVIENHFSIPLGKTDLLKPPKHFPTPVLRYTLCEMTIVWHIYGGNDFKLDSDQKKKKSVNFADCNIRDVAYSKSAEGELVFTNFGKEKKLNFTWQVQGGVNRDHDVLMELQLNKVRFQHEVYPETTVQASRQVLFITELEIRDRLATSQINKFLYQYTSQARPKQSHAHMFVVKAIHIRPDPKLKTQECCLKVSLLPLRLNIDQDSLLFLINFFNDLSGNASADEIQQTTSKHSTPTHQPPVMTVNIESEYEITEQAQKMVDENLLILLEENKNVKEADLAPKMSSSSAEDSPPIYFRSIIFSPEVPIRLDYQGKRVDMTHGPLAGLLMGLGQLNCSELRLKRLSNRHGLLGADKLFTYLLHEWLNDIKKNQLPSLLGGVGPMHSLVQLFQGIRDLFWLPIEQYQKDGRIVRGLQRGANSFTTSTAMAALELTSRIIHLIQMTAETAYDMVSPGPSVKRRAKSKGRRKRYHQPQDIREGMANAYILFKEGIGETTDNLIRVASHEHEQKGYSGALGGVLRQIPSTIVKPIIIASEATSNVLGGMKSQLVPDARREAKQKWRNDEDG